MHRLDAFLKAKIGYPIHVILSFGIASDIIHNIREIKQKIMGGGENSYMLLVISLAVGFILLIHQLGELSESVARREERNRRKRTALNE